MYKLQIAGVGQYREPAHRQVTKQHWRSAVERLLAEPDFTPRVPAFYYARVIQDPAVRHSLLDVISLGREHAEGPPDTIQERAYSSPIRVTAE